MRLFALTALLFGCGGAPPPPVAAPKAQAQWVEEEESEPDDGLVVEGLKGHLPAAQAAARLRKYEMVLRACYATHSKRKKFVGGSVTMDFLVATDGSVKQVDLRGDLGSWAVEKCLLEVARDVRFPTPEGGEAELTLPLEFQAPRSVEFWDTERIEKDVRKFRKDLRECRGPRVKKRVTVYVGRRGKVRSVGFSGKSIPDEWKDCANPKISDWAFEDPLGRIAKVSFSLPR